MTPFTMAAARTPPQPATIESVPAVTEVTGSRQTSTPRRIALRGERAVAVYADLWRPILEALGVLEVRRATEIEYEAQSGDWVAVFLESGQEIGRSKSRNAVIAQEVAWLEAHRI